MASRKSSSKLLPCQAQKIIERRYERFCPEKRTDIFNAGQEDVFRLVNTSPLRRLSGITQVVAANPTHPHHHRLIHVVEVAQIGRLLADQLIAQSPAVCPFRMLFSLHASHTIWGTPVSGTLRSMN